MAFTRAMVEFEVVDRTKGLLSFPGVNLSILTNGSNPNLAGPIAQALTNLSVFPTDPSAPGDADVALVPASSYFALIGLATYYTIQKCLGNFVMTNEGAQDRKQDWDSTKRTFQAMYDSLGEQYKSYLNINIAPPIVGRYPSTVPWPIYDADLPNRCYGTPCP